ncbi:IPT/TIG domain-containing protein, partial [Candidatus Dependentiae bacterium]|nr:IPT/TIG domain-containing protein [Candidatus Dependentiae bacterium]
TTPQIPLNGDQKFIEQFIDRAKDKEMKIYSTNEFFPAKNNKINSSGIFRKYSYVNITVYPFRYNPVSKELKIIKNFIVNINYDDGRSGINLDDAFYYDDKFRDIAKKGFVNFNQFDSIYHRQRPAKSKNGATYDYLIVVPSINADIEFMLQDFLLWKKTIGHQVKLIDFAADCGGTAEGLRNYLKANYLSWNSEFLLIISNDDEPVQNPATSTTKIPMINTYPPGYMNPYASEYPSDYMYADLTGDWDSSGNGKYGEYDEYVQLDTGVDLAPEIYVGRIPITPNTAGNRTAIKSFFTRSIAFEQEISARKDNIILAGTVLFYQNQDHGGWDRIDGALIMEKMRNDGVIPGTGWRMYEEAGLTPTPGYYSITSDEAVTDTNFYNRWKTGNFASIAWFAHGAWYGSYRTVWEWDDGDNVPESATEFDHDACLVGYWYDYTGCSDCIVFSGSCLNSESEEDNLGKVMLANASVGFLGCSRVSYGDNYSGDPAVEYGFYYRLLKSGQTVGEALYNTTHLDAAIIDCYADLYQYNLYGDPGMNYFGVDCEMLTVKTITPNAYPNIGVVSITAITGTGFNVGATVKLTKSAESPIHATNVVVSDSSTITCDLDLTGETTGNWNLAVTNPDTTVYTLQNAFLIQNRPAEIYSISPSSGYCSGVSDELTITGEYFKNGAQISLTKTGEDPLPAQDISYVNSTTIKCKFDLYHKELGFWRLKIVNPNAPATVKNNAFEILINFPYITGLNPSLVKPENGVEVKVHGFYLKTGCEVKLKREGWASITPTSSYIYATSEYECDLICNFDFINREPGVYDCEIKNPDGKTFVLKNALTIVYPDFGNLKYYPNPSRGRPIVFNNLPEGTTIKIYDSAGTLVATLHDYERKSSITWTITREDGTKVPSGIYFAYMKGKGCVKTIKIAVVK